MIGLERNRKAVHGDFSGPTRKARLLELFKAAAGGLFEPSANPTAADAAAARAAAKARLFTSSRWKSAKQQLGIETFGKCAFCETPNAPGYYGDVEHFRPKAAYWWLAYCYDNYLYSCRVCNGNKGEKHRRSGNALTPPPLVPGMDDDTLLGVADLASPDPADAARVGSYEQACLAELGDLPNPYQENPEYLFEWHADPDLKEVTIAGSSASPRHAAAMSAALDILKLNRPELRVQRWRAYKIAKRFYDRSRGLSAAEREGIEDGLRDLAEAEMPFAGMMRYFLRQWGLLPPLP
jgi:hypothetical protein